MPTEPATTTGTVSPRLRRHESQALTRARLLAAAADVFARKGFRAATIADVAEQAGYTIGAVYSNFESKDGLFQALMSERLAHLEADLETAFGDGPPESPASRDERIELELERLQAAEDAVPAGWWRLINEYRGYVADQPAAKAELAALDRRCREIIARHVERFASVNEIDLPLSPIELVELTNALVDGMRAAHADGRASMTSGEGVRLVVESLIASAIGRPIARRR